MLDKAWIAIISRFLFIGVIRQTLILHVRGEVKRTRD